MQGTRLGGCNMLNHSRWIGRRMSLEQLSYLAQVIGSVGVIFSLVFVGLQIRQNTAALQRNEHNSTMSQWTVLRMGIAENRELAEFMTAGLSGERELDTADQFRLEQFLQEHAWAAFHIWDRTQRGVFAKGTFELTGGAYLSGILRTKRGSAWWSDAKAVGFDPGFVADLDALLLDSGAQPTPAPQMATVLAAASQAS
jgi:hypothetical protein